MNICLPITAPQSMILGSFQKRSIPHPQRKFPPSGEGNCLKNVLNLYMMSGEGEVLLFRFEMLQEIGLARGKMSSQSYLM